MRPAGPTNGFPSRSSRSPGCSPRKISLAFAGPSPNTVWVPVFHRSQARQPAAASRSFGNVARSGTKVAAVPSTLRTYPGLGRANEPGIPEAMKHTAHGHWLEEAGPVSPVRELEEDISADVVVVGGGYTGMWAAWFIRALAPEANVVLLERDICGHGPSGRNGAFANAMWFNLPALRL